MRDYIVAISPDYDAVYAHVYLGPIYWIVEFDEDAPVSPAEVAVLSAVMMLMQDDREVQFEEES